MTRSKITQQGLAVMYMAVCLTGCSLFQTNTSSSDTQRSYEWTQIKPALENIRSWKILGKIGIRTADDSVSAAINSWIQIDDAFDINLSSTFFGLGTTKISGDNQTVLLERSGEPPLFSYSPNTLIHEALGVPLPIQYLRYWVRMLPEPFSEYEQKYGENGLPHSLEQQGWSIQYQRFDLDSATPLPSKMVLSNDQARIILAIKEWQLNTFE